MDSLRRVGLPPLDSRVPDLCVFHTRDSPRLAPENQELRGVHRWGILTRQDALKWKQPPLLLGVKHVPIIAEDPPKGR